MSVIKSVFLDTSAFLKLVFREKEEPQVRKMLTRAQTLTASRLLQVEADRAIIRYSLDYPEKYLRVVQLRSELHEFWSIMSFAEIDPEICDLARAISPHSRLRSLDAIHLATYLKAKEFDPSLYLLTFDQKMKAEAGQT